MNPNGNEGRDGRTQRKPRVQLPLGQLVATPGAISALARAGQDPLELIERHRHGDWGDLDPEDAAANDAAVTNGGRILSAYLLKNGVRLWVITESSRAATTLLLPSEY